MHDHYFCRWRELLSQLSDFHKCCCTVTQLSLKSHTPATSKIHTHSAKASSPGLLPQNKLKVRQPAHLQPCCHLLPAAKSKTTCFWKRNQSWSCTEHRRIQQAYHIERLKACRRYEGSVLAGLCCCPTHRDVSRTTVSNKQCMRSKHRLRRCWLSFLGVIKTSFCILITSCDSSGENGQRAEKWRSVLWES